MRARGMGALCVGLLCLARANAQDRLDVTAEVDMRWVAASGAPSYLNGGEGLLRFDPDHEGVRLGDAFLDAKLRLTDILSAHVVAEAFGDHDRNLVDLSEAYLALRPFPSGAIRWSAKAGAFFMPVSLENRGPAWGDVYTITPSALNTWIGEEFRTIGTELEARWLGASQGYLGDVSLVGAIYGWNDPAGELLADRGFGLTDRLSTLFGGIGEPPQEAYHEVDRKPGYYGGLSWRHHDWLELRALRYDNRADPYAETSSAYAWRTRFSSVGARLEPSGHWSFIAQYLDGDTAVATDVVSDPLFVMNYRTAFALASFLQHRERFTVRYDDFQTHQVSGFYGLPANQVGHAWTLGWMHDLGRAGRALWSGSVLPAPFRRARNMTRAMR